MHASFRPFTLQALAFLITATSLTAIAQTKKSTASETKTKKAEKQETSKYHRLPAYYGQIKLKDEQVAEIYSIKDTFGKKIDDLEAEIAKLKEEQDEKIKDVLTKTQVTALNKLTADSDSKEKEKETKPSTTKKTSAKKSESSNSSSKKD